MTQKSRVLALALLLVVLVALITGCLAFAPRDTPSPGPTDPAMPTASATVGSPAFVTVGVPGAPGSYQWAFAPIQAGGKITGSIDANTRGASIESVIKVWLVADYLRQHDTVPTEMLTAMKTMIRESDDDYAQELYENLDADVSTGRMIKLCQLTHTHIVPFWWSLTKTTAADLVQLGWCIASGAAAGPVWTGWLLDVMRTEHHAGRWGIWQGVVPAQIQPDVAYMNGWTEHSTGWQVNCLAIGPTWILALTTNYPGTFDESHGAAVCADVARQLTSVLPAPASAPSVTAVPGSAPRRT